MATRSFDGADGIGREYKGARHAGGRRLFRLQRALGTEAALFPNVRRATTIDAVERDPVRVS
jgi:hypothetical protein